MACVFTANMGQSRFLPIALAVTVASTLSYFFMYYYLDIVNPAKIELSDTARNYFYISNVCCVFLIVGTFSLIFSTTARNAEAQLHYQLNFIRDIFGKYVPESVAQKVIEQQGTLTPVRTNATILYTDIAGFTAAVEQMPLEQVFGMLNDYFPAVIEPITKYGGVVNQFQGDAMLVTFNVPVSDALHADHAIMAAIAILKVTRDREFGGHDLKTRIGITTGEIVVGNVGSGDRFNYTVHGDAVNLAARLEQLNKEYGTQILVSDKTVAACNNQYDNLVRLGDVSIRGKQGLVEVYQLDC